MLGAILLDERSRGNPTEDIERRWGITGFAGSDKDGVTPQFGCLPDMLPFLRSGPFIIIFKKTVPL